MNSKHFIIYIFNLLILITLNDSLLNAQSECEIVDNSFIDWVGGDVIPSCEVVGDCFSVLPVLNSELERKAKLKAVKSCNKSCSSTDFTCIVSDFGFNPGQNLEDVPIGATGLVRCREGDCFLYKSYKNKCNCVTPLITIPDSGQPTILCGSESTQLSVVANLTNPTYQWFVNDSIPLDEENQDEITITESGCYFVIVSDTTENVIASSDIICISCTQSIPTLSQWSLVILSLLILIIGGISIRREQKITSHKVTVL